MQAELSEAAAQAGPTEETSQPGRAPRVLFVDNEPRILRMLERSYAESGWTLHFADNGADALALLEAKRVDVVVADMKMPGMSGGEFLAEVYQRYPDVTSVLMSGYSDLTDTVEAVNKGHIYSYIRKSAESYEFKLMVYQAYLRTRQIDEQKMLWATLKRKNTELESRKAELESRVKERTAELRDAIAALKREQYSLQQCQHMTVRLFSHLIELRGNSPGHGQRVAALAERMIEELSSDESQWEQVQVAALLHDIGKVSLSDEELNTPAEALSREQLQHLQRHPQLGAGLVSSLTCYDAAARMIRFHHEAYDGSGYPDRLTGTDIPLGAQILGLASDYDDLVTGGVDHPAMPSEEALRLIAGDAGSRYDPRLVRRFEKIVRETADAKYVAEVESADLEPHVVLARDIVTTDGVILLSRGDSLDEALIGQLRQFEQDAGESLRILVQSG